MADVRCVACSTIIAYIQPEVSGRLVCCGKITMFNSTEKGINVWEHSSSAYDPRLIRDGSLLNHEKWTLTNKLRNKLRNMLNQEKFILSEPIRECEAQLKSLKTNMDTTVSTDIALGAPLEGVKIKGASLRNQTELWVINCRMHGMMNGATPDIIDKIIGSPTFRIQYSRDNDLMIPPHWINK
jgi:hypothetical protein